MNKPDTLDLIQSYVNENCPSILPHLLNTAEIATSLALAHDISVKKARIAAMGHDIFRYMTDKEILVEVDKNRAPLSDLIKAKSAPVLYHGPLAAIRFPQLFHYSEPDVMRAIWNHSIISTEPEKLETILFISDKMDPLKNRKNRIAVINTAFKDLYGGLYRLINSIVRYYESTGFPIHSNYLTFLEKFSTTYKIV